MATIAGERTGDLPVWMRITGCETRQDLKTLLLLVPAGVFLAVFFIYPLTRLFIMGLFDPDFTLQHYLKMFTHPLYLRVLWITLKVAATVTIVCLALGYPLAALLSMVREKVSSRLFFMILIPYWTSILIRAYCWTVILQRKGLVNTFLANIGVIDKPLHLMFNTTGVIIGTVHVFLPLMIMPLYSVMSKVNVNLLRASAGMGAGPVKTFLRVYFPLTLPGVAGGSLLVFILSLGLYITPALMGGRRDILMSIMIEQQVREFLNWGFASALSFTLLFVTLLLYFAAVKWLGLNLLWGGKR